MADHFIIPARYYFITFLALVILTIASVYFAKFVETSGAIHIVLAMVFAAIKAFLVLGIFMGLKWDKGINIAFLSFGILFFLFFLSFTLLDVATRGSIVVEEQDLIDAQTPVRIEGEEQPAPVTTEEAIPSSE